MRKFLSSISSLCLLYARADAEEGGSDNWGRKTGGGHIKEVVAANVYRATAAGKIALSMRYLLLIVCYCCLLSCQDTDERDKSIKQALEKHLAGRNGDKKFRDVQLLTVETVPMAQMADSLAGDLHYIAGEMKAGLVKDYEELHDKMNEMEDNKRRAARQPEYEALAEVDEHAVDMMREQIDNRKQKIQGYIAEADSLALAAKQDTIPDVYMVKCRFTVLLDSAYINTSIFFVDKHQRVARYWDMKHYDDHRPIATAK